MKKLIFLVLLAAAAGGGWYVYHKKHPENVAVTYRTAPVKRGTIVQEIRATGTIKPIKQVEVGTQVNGRVLNLYVDFNSVVTANQVVAQIDPAVYEANHAKDCAQLKSNQANVEQIAVKLALAEKDLARKIELADRKMLALSDLDIVRADRDSLTAQLKIAQASIEQSQATVKLSKANLDYCTIRSPVDGVVIARNVDEGQTVVSSMSAQKLFLVATDLKRIQVEASIPEADVGAIREDQPVSFTVDAYRDTFTGVVRQIRLAATSVLSVVTYPVIVEADNPDEKLFPGMTANIGVEVARKADTLMIPAAALRFMPTNLVTDVRGPKVWVLNADGIPEAVSVKLGISDGTHTAIEEPDTLQDKEVILGIQSGQTASNNDTPKNPFMPTPPGGGGSKGHNVRHAMR
ncbi:MAG: efflux RND transporter periplasmic adaptor subunit [bacterium]